MRYKRSAGEEVGTFAFFIKEVVLKDPFINVFILNPVPHFLIILFWSRGLRNPTHHRFIQQVGAIILSRSLHQFKEMHYTSESLSSSAISAGFYFRSF